MPSARVYRCTRGRVLEFPILREWETLPWDKLLALLAIGSPPYFQDTSIPPAGRQPGRDFEGLMCHANPRQACGFLIPRISRRIKCVPGVGVDRLEHAKRVFHSVARLIILSRMISRDFHIVCFLFTICSRSSLKDDHHHVKKVSSCKNVFQQFPVCIKLYVTIWFLCWFFFN